ncbi:short-chain dehydrogenase [Camillea tinctor]|nr:short-chain dehydrogenase [Camillea tinctor]
MNNKAVILVANGNQGLGHEAFKTLARTKKYDLVVAARSGSRSEEAINTNAYETGSDFTDFTPVTIDLSDDESIFAVVEAVKNNLNISKNTTLRENCRSVFKPNYQTAVYGNSKAAANRVVAVDVIMLQHENISIVLVEPGYCCPALGGYQDHKDADASGKVIARAAVEGNN